MNEPRIPPILQNSNLPKIALNTITTDTSSSRNTTITSISLLDNSDKQQAISTATKIASKYQMEFHNEKDNSRTVLES